MHSVSLDVLLAFPALTDPIPFAVFFTFLFEVVGIISGKTNFVLNFHSVF